MIILSDCPICLSSYTTYFFARCMLPHLPFCSMHAACLVGCMPPLLCTTTVELPPPSREHMLICQGHSCKCKWWVMGPDPQCKLYGALTVQFRDKYWFPGANARSQELREVMEQDEQGDMEEAEWIWDWWGCKMIRWGQSEMIWYESMKGSVVMRQGEV